MVKKEATDRLNLNEDEWKKRLTQEEYEVLREKGTEWAFTGKYAHETKPGVYHCAGCGQPLFLSEHKFDSGTGWPSFFQPLSQEAVGYEEDNSLLSSRVEVHCSKCGGHLGHVFKDGPDPTGLRYCLNSVSLKLEDQ